MKNRPESIEAFLQSSCIAVAGVSRERAQPANAIFRRLREAGHRVFPINPGRGSVEGEPCYPDVASLPQRPDGVVFAAPPSAALEVVRQCAEAGVARVWFHRSFGAGSVSDAAVRECRERGVESIVGGCPMMFCEPVDVAHRCMRWWLQRTGAVPR